MLAFYLATIDTLEQREQFEYVYRNYSNMMYKTALSIAKSPELAEDAVHETFLQIIKEIDFLRTNNENELKSYLYILTRERTIDFLRKWERKKGITQSTDFEFYPPDIQEPEQIALTNIQLESALHFIYTLPETYRRPLLLRTKGYSIREIAQMTETSEANVKTRIHRARQIILHFFDN